MKGKYLMRKVIEDSDVAVKEFEYRVCWSASSNINFHGATEWRFWGEADSAAEVEDALCHFTGTSSQALDEMIEASGLDWQVEVRAKEQTND